MEIESPQLGSAPVPGRIPLSPKMAMLLAIAIGLGGGFLDLVMMIFKKHYWSDPEYFGSGRDFLWSVPVVHVVLLLIPGALMVAISRLLLGRVSLRVGSWLFVTLAIWAALLRTPLHGASAVVLAAGLARPISGLIATGIVRHPRRARQVLASLFVVLIIMAALSTGRQAIREHRALAGLPPPPPRAQNVVLIVWDTVRAASLSLHDYPRDTTPNLVRWARRGVQFSLSLAPAPWTYASHSCFFTGQWPHKLNSQWKHTLDAPDPTLAEYLASRGYQTAGFAANTIYASHETGLDRGFTHYEDYPLTPLYLLGRTVPGAWILNNILNRGDFYAQKWIRLQSRSARGINDAFIDWLARRRQDRPFFAFLNYFDAHAPYMPAAETLGRFGTRPEGPRDYQLLLDHTHTNSALPLKDVLMIRDCYDDCIAFLDDQLGRLLDELNGQGILDNTLVIITSDHGEAFGYHGIFGHGGSLYLDEIAVPLVILSPRVPKARVVAEPVSLRDLPATIVDQLGLTAGAPFQGRSLAALWQTTPGQSPPATTAAFSELAHASAFLPRVGPTRPGLQMSFVAFGQHYIRDGTGTEQLFDLVRDPFETANLVTSAEGNQMVGIFRRMLLKLLTDNPGSIEVENAYLKPFRQRLKTLVNEGPGPPEALTNVMTR
jgi:arylsulfatase A-like enzyme